MAGFGGYRGGISGRKDVDERREWLRVRNWDGPGTHRSMRKIHGRDVGGYFGDMGDTLGHSGRERHMSRISTELAQARCRIKAQDIRWDWIVFFAWAKLNSFYRSCRV